MLRRVVLVSMLAGAVQAESWKLVAEGNRDFACRLYRQLAGQPGNLFFSPHSISVAMAMTYAGARGETAPQMKAAMRFPGAPEEVPPMFQSLDDTLAELQGEGGVAWTVANSLWPHQQYVFRDEYMALVAEAFRSEVIPVDFADSEDARLRINHWVEDKTRERIKDLIPSGVLNSLTRMVLVNAVYFKGTWRAPFLKDLTAEREFTMADGVKIQTPTMYGKIRVRYGALEGVSLLELPYQGGRVVMLVALPEDPAGLPALEQTLDAATIASWRGTLREEEVQVYLPAFSMTSQFGLNETLSALGMRDAFVEGVADFSGMDGVPGNLFISDVIHKAFVEVNEEGTEAAAATGVIMQARSMPRPSPEFRADHPFLFLIMDQQTESVLFAGRLVDPRK